MTDDLKKPLFKCPGCGQRVTVYSSGEGTNSYEPWCEEKIKGLEATLKASSEDHWKEHEKHAKEIREEVEAESRATIRNLQAVLERIANQWFDPSTEHCACDCCEANLPHPKHDNDCPYGIAKEALSQVSGGKHD